MGARLEGESRVRTFIGLGVVTALILIGLDAIFDRLGAATGLSVLILVVGATLMLMAAGLIGRTIDGERFFIAGRRVGPWANALALTGSALSGVVVLGVPSQLLARGFDAAILIFSLPAGLVLMLALFAGPFRRQGAWSVAGFLGAHHGSTAVRIAAVLAVLAVAFLLLHVELRLAGGLLATLVGVSPWTALMLAAAAVVLGAAPGGLRSVSFVAASGAAFTLLAVLLPATIWSVRDFGSALPMLAMKEPMQAIDLFLQEGVRAGLAQPESLRSFANAFGTTDRFNVLVLVLSLPLGVAVLPHLLQRAGASADGGATGRSIAYALVLAGLALATLPVYAILAKLALVQTLLGAPVGALPPWALDLSGAGLLRVCGTASYEIDAIALACRSQSVARLGFGDVAISGGAVFIGAAGFAGLGGSLQAILAAGAVSASLGSAAALAQALAHALSQDLLPGRAFRARSIRRQSIARLLVAVVLVLSVIAIGTPDDGIPLLPAMLALYTVGLAIAASSLAPALLSALFLPRVSALGITLGIVAGGGVAGAYAAAVISETLPALAVPLLTDGIRPEAAAVLGIPTAILGQFAGTALSRAATETRAALLRRRAAQAPT